jgi:hypothetical protein
MQPPVLQLLQSVLTASFTYGETASQSMMVLYSAMTIPQMRAHWR